MPDLAAHIHALGFSAFPVSAGAFQATPMRHGGDYVGGFFLGGREGGFTEADEETLVLFAQQAAVAEPLTCASANSEEHSSMSCCRAQPLKLDRKPWVTASNPSCGSPRLVLRSPSAHLAPPILSATTDRRVVVRFDAQYTEGQRAEPQKAP